jgi:Bacterial extracellular solute-binding proteins, family 5 Middle
MLPEMLVGYHRNVSAASPAGPPGAHASTNLLVNRETPPFDNPDLRRALALALDRKSFIDILAQGQGDIGGAMLPPPAGVWGMPPEVLATIPGYGPDVAKNRAEARDIMQRLRFGPDKRLAIKVAARNIAGYRDPAIILIDQLGHCAGAPASPCRTPRAAAPGSRSLVLGDRRQFPVPGSDCSALPQPT